MGASSPAPQPPNKQFGLDNRSTASNEQANPLPYLAGSRRFAGTFITDAFDQSSQSAGGGKKSGGTTGTNYYCSFAIAFCLGPVDVFKGLYFNGDDVFTSNQAIVPANVNVANNVVTMQTSNAHGFPNDQVLLVIGADQPEINGEFTITVLDPKTFQ